MKISDIIKMPFREIKESHKAKHKEKMLIKTDNDQLVVDSLPADEDNSAIDIQKVIKNMDDPENMAEVVENNLEEIIMQDNVRRAFFYLNDDDAMRILNKNKNILKKEKKTKNAIDAIGNNKKKLRAVLDNISDLTDIELVEILKKLKPEKKESRQEAVDQIKVKIITLKIIQHVKEDKGVWHLEEFSELLKDREIFEVMQLFFNTIHDREKNKNEQIDFKLKMKVMVTLLNVTDTSYSQKIEMVNEYVKNGLFTKKEGSLVAQRIATKEIFEKVIDKKEQELKEIVDVLPEYCRISVIGSVLKLQKKSEERKKPILDFSTKTRLVKTLFDINGIGYDKEIDLLESRYTKDNLLTLKEKSEINKMILLDRIIKKFEINNIEWDWEKEANKLTEESKMEMAGDCIIGIHNYETENGEKIDDDKKVELINRMLNLTDGNYQLKADSIFRYEEAKLLNKRVVNQVIENLIDRALEDSPTKEQEANRRCRKINI